MLVNAFPKWQGEWPTEDIPGGDRAYLGPIQGQLPGHEACAVSQGPTFSITLPLV